MERELKTLKFNKGEAILPFRLSEKRDLSLTIGEIKETKTLNPIPLAWSILPPLVAILLALLLKKFTVRYWWVY